MRRRAVGAGLIAFGVAAWGVYAVLASITEVALSPLPFLAWHLAGVVPGSYLFGNPLVVHVIRALIRRRRR